MIEINKLIRSKRKTLSLIVEIDGTLTVRAPLRMKEADIRRFIEAKKSWVKRKQAQTREEAVIPHQFMDGETFWYLGQEVPLRIVPGGEACPRYGQVLQAGRVCPVPGSVCFRSLVQKTGARYAD